MVTGNHKLPQSLLETQLFSIRPKKLCLRFYLVHDKKAAKCYSTNAIIVSFNLILVCLTAVCIFLDVFSGDERENKWK